MRGRRALSAALVAAGAAACGIDFVAVEDESPAPAARLSVRSTEEGDSIVVRLEGVLVGLTDPRVTLAGVPVEVAGSEGDAVFVELSLILPATARVAELAMPRFAEGGLARVVVRIGTVRRTGAAAVEGADLVLPWGGPRVSERRGDWSLDVEHGEDSLLRIAGLGDPPRPLRLPLELIGGPGAPTSATLSLRRSVVVDDAFYPLELSLSGETAWAFPGTGIGSRTNP